LPQDKLGAFASDLAKAADANDVEKVRKLATSGAPG